MSVIRWMVGLPVIVAALASRAEAQSSDDPPVDFVREIRPILSQHCFACHGPDEAARKAGLSLMTFEDATTPLRSGSLPIVPGDLDASEVWQRITDPIDPMPPADVHDSLADAEIDLLRRWIEHGASYAPHWAYVPPAMTPIPAVVDASWPRDDIDFYILARLDSEGITPAPDADPVTLLRRLTYDLTGLPPSPSEIDALLIDVSPTAIEETVDRLLASHHFGERMAMYWLDLVRYADTVGYHGDQGHRIWPYRDYVIRAFNENLPFDRFTIEQLAGDLLKDPTQAQLVATGYNRLLQTSHEGGIQLKEYRAIYQADRIRNVSGVWIGATVGCAQCHDHKYDPYTARDFYAMGAFFADIDDEEHLRDPYGGLNALPTRRSPEMPVLTELARRERAALLLDVTAAEGTLARTIAGLPQTQPQWEDDLRAALAQNDVHETVWVDDRLDTGGETQGAWTFVDQPVTPHSGAAYRIQSSADLTQHYSVNTTRTIDVTGGDSFYTWIHLDAKDPPKAVMVQFNVNGDWAHRALWGGDEIVYGRRQDNWDGYRRQGSLPESGVWVRLDIPFDSIGIEAGEVVSGVAFTQFGGTVYWDQAGVRSTQGAPDAVVEALLVAPSERTASQRDTLSAHHAATSPVVKEQRRTLDATKDRLEAFNDAQPRTMYTRALSEPREVRILPRGNWLDETGEIVTPAVPVSMGSLQHDGDRATRLDLARWFVTPAAEGGVGELTARVFVNRIWAVLFGEGLCPSTEDFGGQGRPPTYPELLDRLAIEFVQSGWDVKALVRRLVLSRTYQQASTCSNDVADRDPDNLLFARQARYRLPAEMVRDTMLAVSGLLVDELGGPGVRPPQPEGHYRHLNFPRRIYQPDMGAEQWRRGIYVHWQRQFLHPMFRAFDAPSREECTPRRTVSNTPVAALALLNDPVFIEASRVFAESLLRESDDRVTVLRDAMRRAIGRRPTSRELDVLLHLLDESQRHYDAHPDDAEALLAVGSSPVAADIDASTLAAWMQVTRAILNLHETITRE